MEKLKWGDITIIGITTSDRISIEFYNPGQCDGTDYSIIFLTIEQAELINKLGEILRVKAN